MTKAANCLLVVSFLCFPVVASCQAPGQTDSTLSAVESLYESGSYISAELQARRMLEDNTLSDTMRLQFEKYVAFSLIAQGKNEPAVEHFLIVLKIDSSFSLDPVLTSPKILSVFQTAKSQLLAQEQKDREKSAGTQGQTPAGIVSPSRGPTFRAIVFPGWDQLYHGKSTKGYVLLGAGAVSAASSIMFDLLRRSARNSYLAAGTPELASSRYKTYNLYYKAEFYSISAFIVIYVYSEIDSFLDLPPYVKVNNSPQSPGEIVGIHINF